MARRIHIEPRGKTVGAIDDNVRAVQKLGSVACIQPRLFRLDTDIRVQRCQRQSANLRLGRPDIARHEQHLPLQVRQRHRIIVDQRQRTNTRRRQIHRRRPAQRAQPHQRDLRLQQLLLPRPADLAQHYVPGVAFQLLGS